MKNAVEWFEAYGVSHKNKTNIIIHKFCVPLIFFSILALFFVVPTPEVLASHPFINWASLLALCGWIFYFSLGLRVLSLMVVQTVIFYTIVLYLDQYFNVGVIGGAIFVSAWILQFVGHKIEGKKPSFLDDISFLFIGPAWVFRQLIGYK
jgi:uncharacterized membrane protein YGL010W